MLWVNLPFFLFYPDYWLLGPLLVQLSEYTLTKFAVSAFDYRPTRSMWSSQGKPEPVKTFIKCGVKHTCSQRHSSNSNHSHNHNTNDYVCGAVIMAIEKSVAPFISCIWWMSSLHSADSALVGRQPSNQASRLGSASKLLYQPHPTLPSDFSDFTVPPRLEGWVTYRHCDEGVKPCSALYIIQGWQNLVFVLGFGVFTKKNLEKSKTLILKSFKFSHFCQKAT